MSRWEYLGGERGTEGRDGGKGRREGEREGGRERDGEERSGWEREGWREG